MYCIENCKKSESNNPCRHLWMTTLEIARKYRFILFAWRQKVFHAPEKNLNHQVKKLMYGKMLLQNYINSKNRKKRSFKLKDFLKNNFCVLLRIFFQFFSDFVVCCWWGFKAKVVRCVYLKTWKRKQKKTIVTKKFLNFDEQYIEALDVFVVTLCFLKDFMGEQRGGGRPFAPPAGQGRVVSFCCFYGQKRMLPPGKKSVAHVVFSLVHICLWKPK